MFSSVKTFVCFLGDRSCAGFKLECQMTFSQYIYIRRSRHMDSPASLIDSASTILIMTHFYSWLYDLVKPVLPDNRYVNYHFIHCANLISARLVSVMIRNTHGSITIMLYYSTVVSVRGYFELPDDAKRAPVERIRTFQTMTEFRQI